MPGLGYIPFPEEDKKRRDVVKRGIGSGIAQIIGDFGSILHWAGIERVGQEIEEWADTQQAKYLPPEDIRGSILEKPDLLKDPDWWIYNTFQMLPSLLTTWGTTGSLKVGARAAANAGNLARARLLSRAAIPAGMTVGGALEGAGVYREAREEGLSDPRVRGLAGGLFTAATEYLPLHHIFGPLGKYGIPGKMAASSIMEGLQEWSEEPLQALALGHDPIKAAKEGVNVIPVSMLAGLMGGGAFGATQVSSKLAPHVPRVDQFTPQTAFEFYSPNTMDLDYDTARANLNTDNHKYYKDIAQDINKKLGINADMMDAIGDTSKWGADNSIVERINGEIDPELLTYAAAWKGLLGNQKAVLTFIPGQGEDSLYMGIIPDEEHNVRAVLDRFHIYDRTLTPTPEGILVQAFDPKSKKLKMINRVGEFYDTTFQAYKGLGIFQGGETREAARDNYLKTIQLHDAKSQIRYRPETGVYSGGPRQTFSRLDFKLPEVRAAAEESTKRLMRFFDNGRGEMRWYDFEKERLSRLFGEDTDTFLGFLAATSQHTALKANVSFALKAYEQWKQGKPFTGYLPDVKKNLERVAKGQPLKSKKVSSFLKALQGDPDAVVIDLWMKRAFGLQKNTEDKPLSDKQYDILAEKIRKMARDAGVSPKQFQAAVWLAFKRENQINNGELDTYHSLVGKALRNGKWKQVFQQVNTYASRAPAISFTPEEMIPMTKTSRGRGAVGKKAMVPKQVAKIAKPTDSILDFGAGKEAAHAQQLKKMGLDVTAYEDPAFGNFNDKLHDMHALGKKYDIVYASNVMNVQPSLRAFRKTLAQIVGATKTDGKVILNYTATPRHTKMPNGKTMTTAQARAEIEKVFGNVEQVGGTKNSPVWQATKPQPQNIPEQVYLFSRVEHRAPPKTVWSKDGKTAFTTYGTSLLKSRIDSFDYEPVVRNLVTKNIVRNLEERNILPEPNSMEGGILFDMLQRYQATGVRGRLGEFLEILGLENANNLLTGLEKRIRTEQKEFYEKTAPAPKQFIIEDIIIPKGERREVVVGQLVRAALRSAYNKKIRNIGFELSEDMPIEVKVQLGDVMQNMQVEGVLSGANREVKNGKEVATGTILKKPYLTPPKPPASIVNEQISSFNERFGNKTNFFKKPNITKDLDSSLDRHQQYFNFPENNMLDTTVQPPSLEEAAHLSTLLDSFRDAGMAETVLRQVKNIGVMSSTDNSTEGMYVPGYRAIVLKKGVVGAMEKAADNTAVQQGMSVSLSHELGHSIDISPKGHPSTSRSPLFNLDISTLSFSPEPSFGYTKMQKLALGKFGNIENAGAITREVLEFYNSDIAKQASFSEFLLYPLSELESLLMALDSQIFATPDGSQKTLREIMQSAPSWDPTTRIFVNSVKAQLEQKVDWVKAETFAQLHAIYWTYPSLMQKYMPRAYELFKEIQYATNSATNPWDAHNAVRDVLQSESPDVGPADFAEGASTEIAEGAATRQPGEGMGADRLLEAKRGSGPGVGQYRTRRPESGIPGTESAQENVEDVFSRILDAIRTPSRYGSTEKLREVVGELPVLLNRLGEQQFPELIDAARGGKQTIADIAAMGEQLGVDPDWIRKNILERKVGTTLSAPGIHAAMEFLANESAAFGEALDAYLGKLEAGTLSTQDRAEFTRSLLYHALVQAQVSGLRSEAGRALGTLAHYEKTARGWDRETLERVTSLAGGELNVDTIAAMLGNIKKHGNPGAVNKFAREAFTPTTVDKLFELWVNALLTGPQTHVVNMTSNALVSLNDDIVRMVAAGIGKLHGGEKVSFREAMARLLSTPQAFLQAAKALNKAVTDPDFADALTKIEYRHKASIGGPLGKIIRTPGNLLTAEDAAFKAFTRVKEMHALAQRRALQTGERPKTIIDKFLGNKIPKNEQAFYREMRDEVDRVANVATFTNRPGDITRAMIQVLNRHPSMKFIVPFINTPMNIVKYAAKHSPLGLAFSDVKADLKAGGIQRDLAVARMVWGSSIMGTIALLAMQGLITGGGPDDPRERQLLYAMGWQPYSIKIGDEYYAYGRLEPLGMLFGIAADAYEIGERLSYGQSEDLAAMTFGAIAKNITSKTWLRGVSELINVMSDPDRYGRSYVQRLIGTLIPTGVAQVAGVTDPYLRRADDLMSALKRRIPIKSKDVLPRLDLWGNRIKREGGLGPDILSPVYLSTRVNDLVSAELMQLGRETGYFPSRVSKKLRGIELSPEMHNELIKLARKPAYAMLNVMVRSPSWRALSPELREAIVRKVISRTNLAARRALILNHPEFFISEIKRERAG